MSKKIKYVVATLCYCYEAHQQPYIDGLNSIYTTKDDAIAAIESNCQKECDNYNKNRTCPDGEELPFRWEEDGSEQFDYVVRFWDGDDYRTVTGYTILEVEDAESY